MKVRRLALAAICGLLATLGAGQFSAAAAGATTKQGTFPDGATYKIEVPSPWNGTLVLYSHGYVAPGQPNPARDVGDPVTGAWLLEHGYALAGSSYASTGWALKEAFSDQVQVLNVFNQQVGHAKRTIAWGHSLGGIITAGLLQLNPERFTGALPMCGVLAGGVGTWNQALDGAFAFKTLLAPSSALQLVKISNPPANFALAEQVLASAQTTPQGRARLALTAALGDTPGWYDPASPEPAPNDFNTREQNQFLWNQNPDFFFVFALRAELEARAGGNPSWNTGVDYRRQLAKSIDREEVAALYKEAGLSLEADLETLEDAPRIAADARAVDYLKKYIIFNGDIDAPVLTLHTSGDGLVVVNDEQAYESVVKRAGEANLLRQVYVHRAGHCTMTPAETVSAFKTLVRRLDQGHWTSIDPSLLNAQASALGTPLNTAPPAFFGYHPAQFLRPFDALMDDHQDDD